jgi:hypothetical protein
MNSTILALRAITAVTLRRLLLPFIIIAACILVVLYALVIGLMSVDSTWWALLLIPLIPTTLLVSLIGAGLWIASGKLLPGHITKTQRKGVVAFTDKLARLIENGKTPYPIHLFLIGKDVIRGKGSRHLRSLIDDSSSLKDDFNTIRRMFE